MHRPQRYSVNLFRPKKGYMRDEVRVILVILSGWGLVSFGGQLLLARGGSWVRQLSDLTLFDLPLPFFFTAQFLPLWFVLLCLLFNRQLDRITAYHARRKDRIQ